MPPSTQMAITTKNQRFPYATGAKDGANIVVNPGGTYDIYFNDITKQYLFIAK